jgi:4-coumarate--CoA ligase (photoactive yellow protein activation family)
VKAFSIGVGQITRIIAGLAAEELSARFQRHTDFLTIASWSDDAPLGRDGLDLSDEERRACADRAARFFGGLPSSLDDEAAKTLADWAARAATGAANSLSALHFTPAGRDSETQSCRHSADEVFKDAASAASLLFGRRRLVSLVAPHSLLGFEVTVLMPNLQQIEALDARGMTPDELGRTLAFGDVVVATPTLWRYLVGEGLTAPDNAMAVFFGETMTPDLAANLRKAGFGALRELYGSTENGLIAWRDSPTEPFVLFDHWKRKDGRLTRLTPSSGERDVEPMDVLEWTTDRSFRLGARRDGAVQIGAVNVFPDQIAAVIKKHKAVEDCRIRIARHAGGQNRVIARIRLNSEIAPNERTAREIDAWCRMNLRLQERPRIYNFEADLDEE